MEVNHSEQQQQRHARTLAARYKESGRDMVRNRILQYVTVNPAWTPEDLMHMTRFFLRMYGLNNRYLPPDFKREEVVAEVEEKEDGTPDTGGIVPSVEIPSG